ncbi:MAG TPA: TetR family transcriptional regulator [Solirubrobacterales bacterium]|jgi:AcrR family transcriptional regulator
MSSTADKLSTRRSRDSDATRAALLRAARSAFDELGYELATTREIGERAGVDPALIARYFNSKEGLFLASIAAAEAEVEYDVEAETLVAFLLERWDEHGHNPLSRALASLGLSEEMRQQVATVVRERLRLKLGAELERRGVADCEMRAELLVAIAVGVAMTRANGTLEALAGAERGDVLAALQPAIDALISPPARAPR